VVVLGHGALALVHLQGRKSGSELELHDFRSR
jgi:hypothetical protein